MQNQSIIQRHMDSPMENMKHGMDVRNVVEHLSKQVAVTIVVNILLENILKPQTTNFYVAIVM